MQIVCLSAELLTGRADMQDAGGRGRLSGSARAAQWVRSQCHHTRDRVHAQGCRAPQAVCLHAARFPTCLGAFTGQPDMLCNPSLAEALLSADQKLTGNRWSFSPGGLRERVHGLR